MLALIDGGLAAVETHGSPEMKQAAKARESARWGAAAEAQVTSVAGVGKGSPEARESNGDAGTNSEPLYLVDKDAGDA